MRAVGWRHDLAGSVERGAPSWRCITDQNVCPTECTSALPSRLLPLALRRVLGRFDGEALFFVVLGHDLFPPGVAPVGFGHQLGQGLERHFRLPAQVALSLAGVAEEGRAL